MAAPTTPQKPPPDNPGEKPQASSAAPTGSRFTAWVPLLANLLLMPVLAYATVYFFILPKMQVSAASPAVGKPTSTAAKGKESAVREKVTIPLGAKVIVNVAGTMGTRYLLANITLVGTSADLKMAVEKNDAELRDAAAGALSVKTINDLEKPGSRNVIRTELISVFNHVLGEGLVSDIYLTEFAIQ